MTAVPQPWPKVDTDLRWAPYSGWTILFDSADGHDFEATPRDEGAASLTKATAHIARSLAAARLPAVAVLPISTHHITVCDGVNPAMFARSKRRRHHRTLKTGKIERFPRQLRTSIAALLDATSRTFELEVYGAELRNTAIVLNLVPTSASAADFADICTARTQVLQTLGELLCLQLARPWRPHVTLGYLADRTARSSADSVIDRIDGEASQSTEVLRAHSAGLYRFSSMTDFRRVPEHTHGRS